LYTSHKNQKKLLFIPTIEGLNCNGDTSLTLHLNLCIGGIPDWISEEELKNFISQCWLNSGAMNFMRSVRLESLSNKQLFIVKANNTRHWISYILKEGINSWDVENTHLPIE
jgi:hypothetical protein